jgi:hypothetical protein
VPNWSKYIIVIFLAQQRPSTCFDLHKGSVLNPGRTSYSSQMYVHLLADISESNYFFLWSLEILKIKVNAIIL